MRFKTHLALLIPIFLLSLPSCLPKKPKRAFYCGYSEIMVKAGKDSKLQTFSGKHQVLFGRTIVELNLYSGVEVHQRQFQNLRFTFLKKNMIFIKCYENEKLKKKVKRKS